MTAGTPPTETEWERQLSARLPLFGHRNWIVVADSAYPAHSKPGIETIVSDADHLHVARTVLDAIRASGHARAIVYTDTELAFVDEQDAPGVTEYRQALDTALYGQKVNHNLHDQIVHTVDQTAQAFNVLVIKTEMTIPYTSVFFELDCAYWNSEAEERLRQAMVVFDSRWNR
jgi:hypothetical protein